MSADPMDGFPPSRVRLMTLANWRKGAVQHLGFATSGA
jgi:hypothetical protein